MDDPYLDDTTDDRRPLPQIIGFRKVKICHDRFKDFKFNLNLNLVLFQITAFFSFLCLFSMIIIFFFSIKLG